MASATIMVVEDEYIVGNDLRSSLENMGYGVCSIVTSGQDAIERAAHDRPDLILMDVVLKGRIDGIEAAAEIRNSLNIPIIFMTAHSDRHTLERAKITEPFGFLLKPFEEKELHSNIEMALYKHRAEKELRKAHDELEHKVKERTAELAKANEELKKEIEERKQAEKALEERRVFQEAVLECIANGIVTCDSEGTLVYFNRATREFHGLPMEPIPPEEWANHYDLYEPDGKTPLIRERIPLFRALNGEEVANQEMVIAVKGLPPRTLIATGRKLIDAKGTSLGAVVSMNDISKRKQAEKQSNLEHSRLMGILEAIPDGVYIVDQHFNIEYINPVIERDFGKIQGRKCHQYFHNRTESCPWCKNEEVFAGRSVNWEWHLDKNDRYYEIFDTPFENSDGSISKFEIFHDITKRKRAEEALRESEKRFRTVADFTYDWESWNGPDGKYIYVSPSCQRITGYSAEEFMKDPGLFMKVVHPDDRESISMHVKRHSDMERAGDNHINFRIITKGDDVRWISHYCQPVYDEEGNWLGNRAGNRDITDRIKLGEQFAQSQKMESIGRLAGGVAHDFNNLLTTIMGYAEILLTQADKDSPLRNGMEEIKLASDRAASLTGQLLAFSRKQMIQPVVLNINHAVAEMDKMLRRLIGEDIDLITVLEPELWNVKFDPGQVDQVVMNLAVNAKDAMPEGGKLTIETANVDLDETYARQHGVELKPGHFVMVAVSDTGMGIDEETQSQIFDPFFTTKEKGKGTGLGLSTVYGIVKQSGGFVWVYSEPGQGTTFKIYLPKTEAGEAFMAEEQIQPQHLEGSETILLAEDDDSARGLIRSILQEYGYRVLEAQDGEEALRLSEQHEGPIHLLLTDVVMPKMNGRELAERLQPLQPKMKVLYISGYTDNTIVDHGVLESGMQFMQKPFTPKVLASKCRKVLDTCR